MSLRPHVDLKQPHENVYALVNFCFFFFLSVINFIALTKQTRVKLSPHNPRWRLLSKPAKKAY